MFETILDRLSAPSEYRESPTEQRLLLWWVPSGGAGGGFFFIAFIPFTSRKMQNATMIKSITLLMNEPYTMTAAPGVFWLLSAKQTYLSKDPG